MLSKVKNQEKGFTIIEVLIVLVIAGLIMLIVFLAVPALQRNSRNNSRRNDASRISAAVTEYVNNSNGTMPATWANIKPYIGTMSFYTTLPDDTVTIANASANQTVTDENTFPVVAKQATCQTSGANINTAQTGGTDRQFVVLYKVEAGTTVVSQCIGS